MKKLNVGYIFTGVRSKGMMEKHHRGYIVRKGQKEGKAPYFQLWVPREGKPVTLQDGSNMWCGDVWEIWASNAQYLLDNWDEQEALVCKHIGGMRELSRKLKGKDGKDYWETGKTLQVQAELVPMSVAMKEGWLKVED